jgi:alanine racemase
MLTMPPAGRLPVYLKLNTGMNRLGLSTLSEFHAALTALEALPASPRSR